MITARNLHAKLTILGARYLFDHGCELVTTELSTHMNGLPGDYVFDAAGLHFAGEQVHIVEAKTSRSDFLADDALRVYNRVADVCWLICPRGLLRPDELPAGYGLLYADEQGCEIAKRAPRLKPARPLHTHWEALVRAFSRKLTRAYLGIHYCDGRPQPQPIDCLEI